MRRFASLILALLLPLLAGSARAQAGTERPFADWAAVVVAGDWHAHSGGPTEAFDNARARRGRRPDPAGLRPRRRPPGILVRPERWPALKPAKTDLRAIHDDLRDLAARNTAGCLFYLTSHGAPEGAVLDEDILPPTLLAAVIDDACPARPSIVVVSACFSGVFIKPLQRDDRMILTAARPDPRLVRLQRGRQVPLFRRLLPLIRPNRPRLRGPGPGGPGLRGPPRARDGGRAGLGAAVVDRPRSAAVAAAVRLPTSAAERDLAQVTPSDRASTGKTPKPGHIPFDPRPERPRSLLTLIFHKSARSCS